ncbi:MAG: PocR ligand-binding domain-containing protein [Lachnospiraceae bacterium]|nr:PocR ligand-binding domain-containing protein [Lachnospiraceae bacterium]MEE3461417.1 PocR ligand-binding domain-containing protein [Lachnospiraceae bacterium]
MKIEDFCDMDKFGEIMKNWAEATGLACVAVGEDGNYISDSYNFTDFCMKYTRGSEEGRRRCEKCDREGKGIYYCHAGLMDFAIDLEINGRKYGQVIGGQILPENPDEDKFRQTARELGVDPDRYIEALHKVNISTESRINASAELLGQVLNNYINAQYYSNMSEKTIHKLADGIEHTQGLVKDIIKCTDDLKSIEKKQNIVALNASIEAARVGQAGAGFAVVAKEVQKLAMSSTEANKKIESIVGEIADTVKGLTD